MHERRGHGRAWRASRRELLAAAAAGLAAACGTAGGGSSAPPASTHAVRRLERALRLASPPGSIAPLLVTGFGAAHPQVSVGQTGYGSQAELLSQLTAARGRRAFDVLVVDADHVAIERGLGLLKPLDHGLLPNLRYLERFWTQLTYDPGNAYSVIKQAGITGFSLRTDRVKADLRTWSDFFDFLPHAAGLTVNLLDNPAQMVGLALTGLGYSINSEDDGQLAQAEQLLLRVRPYVDSVSSQYVADFENGAIDLGVTSSGDGIQIRAARAGRNDIRVVAPEGRSQLEIDSWCISATAPDPVAAHAWINYVLDPRHNALQMEYTGYEVGTPASFSLVGAPATDPLVVFGPGVLNTYEILRTTPDGLQKRIAIWKRFKAGFGS
jgi:spermidine/putrescine transport system substrate-binding protein